jgi:hypothetical protein
LYSSHLFDGFLMLTHERLGHDRIACRPSNQERRRVPVLSTRDLAECVLKDDFIASESKKVASSGRYQLSARIRRNKVPLK